MIGFLVGILLGAAMNAHYTSVIGDLKAENWRLRAELAKDDAKL